MKTKQINFIFWGSGPLAESSLFALYQNGLVPSLVITSPNKKVGRGLNLQENIIASWCQNKNIKVWQPESLKEINIKDSPLNIADLDLSIVASYPKILKKEILDLPKYKTLNIHPSLLPMYRGPSPIQTALLNGDSKTGVSIIQLDEEIDHGPILIQKEIDIFKEETNEKLERRCGQEGGELLIQILEPYLEGSLKLKEQNHKEATFTRKFNKEDGYIVLEEKANILFNKFRALLPHSPIYFNIKHKTKNEERVLKIKITELDFSLYEEKDSLLAKDIIKKVIPEGKKEMLFVDFKRGYIL